MIVYNARQLRADKSDSVSYVQCLKALLFSVRERCPCTLTILRSVKSALNKIVSFDSESPAISIFV